MAPKRKPQSIHQIKVSLKNIRPPIWRRLQVDSRTTLGSLHNIIQAAMGWGNYHLYTFDIGGEQYGRPHPDWDVRNDARLRLEQFPEGVKFTYTYDRVIGGNTKSQSRRFCPPRGACITPAASRGNAPARRKIAAARGAMRRCCKRSKTPGIRAIWTT